MKLRRLRRRQSALQLCAARHPDRDWVPAHRARFAIGGARHGAIGRIESFTVIQSPLISLSAIREMARRLRENEVKPDERGMYVFEKVGTAAGHRWVPRVAPDPAKPLHSAPIAQPPGPVAAGPGNSPGVCPEPAKGNLLGLLHGVQVGGRRRRSRSKVRGVHQRDQCRRKPDA